MLRENDVKRKDYHYHSSSHAVVNYKVEQQIRVPSSSLTVQMPSDSTCLIGLKATDGVRLVPMLGSTCADVVEHKKSHYLTPWSRFET